MLFRPVDVELDLALSNGLQPSLAYPGFYNGRVHVRAGPEGLGKDVLKWGSGQSLGRWSGRRRPLETEAKCEISIQFLTFSCTKFWRV